VPKETLHNDARDEVEHVWREWRHRHVLHCFKTAVDAYQTPTSSDPETCQEALLVFRGMLQHHRGTSGHRGTRGTHWLEGSEFARRTETAVSHLLSLRRACQSLDWKQVEALTETVAKQERGERGASSHRVRYIDLCRALRLDDSAAVGGRNKSKKALLPVGWKEMKESRAFALEQMFRKVFEKAVLLGQPRATGSGETIPVGELTRRCGEVTFIQQALELGARAGYTLNTTGMTTGTKTTGKKTTTGQAEEERAERAERAEPAEGRFAVELQTLLLLLRLRGAVGRGDFNVLRTVLCEERVRLSASLSSHVHHRASAEVRLLEADDRDHHARGALRRALVAGVVRTTGGERARVSNSGSIHVRPLDQALALVPFVLRSEVRAEVRAVEEVKEVVEGRGEGLDNGLLFVLSPVTLRLVAVGRLCRRLRARCMLSRWSMKDIDAVHGEMERLHRCIDNVQHMAHGECPQSGLVDNEAMGSPGEVEEVEEVVGLLADALRREVVVLRSECNYHCVLEVLVAGALVAVAGSGPNESNEEPSDPLAQALDVSKRLLDDAHNIDANALWVACSELVSMCQYVHDHHDDDDDDHATSWSSIGTNLAPRILQNCATMVDQSLLFHLKPVLDWVKRQYQDYSTRETSRTLIHAIETGAAARHATTGLVEFNTCNVHVLHRAIDSARLRAKALQAAGVDTHGTPHATHNDTHDTHNAPHTTNALVLFSGADARCTMLIQAAMTTLSLREELHKHDDEDNRRTDVSSWNCAVAVAKQATSLHALYCAKTTNNPHRVGCVPASYLKEMNDVLEENTARGKVWSNDGATMEQRWRELLSLGYCCVLLWILVD
jgi:hypothetical protein